MSSKEEEPQGDDCRDEETRAHVRRPRRDGGNDELAIGTLFANGTMVTHMVTMATLFGAHGVGYWEMYARAKAIGKVLN